MSELAIPAVDPRRPRTGLLGLVTRFALTKPGTWLFSEIAARIDPWLMRRSAGRVNLAAGPLPIVLLTVRGRAHGRRADVPLVYFTDGDEVVLIASSFGRPRYPPGITTSRPIPEVTLRAKGRSARFVARETDGEDAVTVRLAKQLYTGYGELDEERDAPEIRHVPCCG